MSLVLVTTTMGARSCLQGARILLVVSLVCGCGAAATPAVATTGTSSSSVSPLPVPSPVPSSTLDPTAGWSRYHSTPNRLGFEYPAGWKVFECGWVFIPANLPGTGCPTDGAGGVVLAGSGVQPNQSFSDISTNPGLYSHVTSTSVTVDAVPGSRISAIQVTGMGEGSSQVEYDFATGATRYVFLAYVMWPGYEIGNITAQFDELVSTVTFG